MADAADYGRALEAVAVLDGPRALDAAISNDHLFYIGLGVFHVADISAPLRPKVVARVAFPGAGRQIAVEEGLACVTARADGLFLFDVSSPRNPRRVAHYDTIELATGIELHGDLAFVAQRLYGVEIVDITDPERPRLLREIETQGNPGPAVVRRGTLIIPDAYNGLLAYDDFVDTLDLKTCLPPEADCPRLGDAHA